LITLSLTYQAARVTDCELLTDIAVRSKKYWNYTDSLIEIWKNDLEVTAEYIKQNIVYKIFCNDLLIGFYGLKFNNQFDCYEIDHLWLSPENINKGYGKVIFKHIKDQLLNKNQLKTIVILDPNSSGFYEKMKGKLVGQVQSKVNGRLLPIYEFDLTKV
jgi:N-acetylglutamate synthase-like GNAT family acetyltransferase